jgi:hypothetical protein
MELEMKRPRKKKPLIPDDEIAEMVSGSVDLFPPNVEGIYRETLAEVANHLRRNEQQSAQNAKRQLESKRKERLFSVTHALMIEFYHRSKIGPDPLEQGGISRNTALKISAMVPLAIPTLQKCFGNPLAVKRHSRAIGARQLVCLALGTRADAYSIEGDRVSFRNEKALLDNVRRALGSAVTVSELKSSIFEADIYRRRFRKKMKLGV